MMKAIHGLFWLAQTETGLQPVDHATSEAIASPVELPDIRMEMHWFSNASEATAFQIGVHAVGRNAVTAIIGIGQVSSGVLVLHADEPGGPAETFEQRIPLIEHHPAAKRQAELIWGDTIKQLERIVSNWSSTFKRIDITEETPERLGLRVRYYRWPEEQADIQKAVQQVVSIIPQHGEQVLEWHLSNLDSFRSMDSETVRPYLDEVYDIALRAGGREYDGNIRFPIKSDLVDVLEQLAPTFAKLLQISYRAEAEERVRQIKRDPDVKRIARAMEAGSQVVSRQPTTLRHPNGKVVRVPEGKFSSMIEIGVIEISGEGKSRTYAYQGGVDTRTDKEISAAAKM